MTTAPREPSRLPIRGTIVTVGTVGALVLLLSFRGGPLAPDEPVLSAEEPPASDELISETATETSGAAAVTEPPTIVPPTADPIETAPSVPEPTTATGQAVAIRWGDVQVAVTVQGDDIIDVETIAIPTDDRRSKRINSYAEPVLREEAIATDSADVSVISGATYTSRAYAASLQSALDQLGA